MEPTSENVQDWIVLIVDDHFDNLTVAEQSLQFHGVEVHTAYDGEKGLALLDRIHPTLFLLDLTMPVMSGWQMLDALRQDPRFVDTPIIAVTAHAMNNDHQKVLDYGFDGYISKPFDVTAFMSDIQAIIQSR